MQLSCQNSNSLHRKIGRPNYTKGMMPRASKKEQCAKKKEELSISGYMYAHNHKKEMQVIGESTNR
jgi:hypothetical protein